MAETKIAQAEAQAARRRPRRSAERCHSAAGEAILVKTTHGAAAEALVKRASATSKPR